MYGKQEKEWVRVEKCGTRERMDETVGEGNVNVWFGGWERSRG